MKTFNNWFYKEDPVNWSLNGKRADPLYWTLPVIKVNSGEYNIESKTVSGPAKNRKWMFGSNDAWSVWIGNENLWAVDAITYQQKMVEATKCISI